MQLRQIEIFLAVARHNSFSKAADALFLAQPTVSAHVRSLEEELDAKLFVRSTKGLSLTPQGQSFYSYATQIVNFCDRAQAEIREISEEAQNRLKIAASTVPSQYFLPRVLPTVKQRFSKICFQIFQGDSTSAIHSVLMGEAEIGVVGSMEKKTDLIYEPLMEERLVVAAPNTPYFHSMGGVMPRAVLQDYAFIQREPGSGTRKTMDDFLISQNIQLEKMQIAAELNSTESVLRCIENGLGISILSKMAADHFAEAGNVLLFDFASPLLLRQFYLVRREDVPLSPAAAYLAQLARGLGTPAAL